MPVIRVRELPRQTNAIQYRGNNVNWDEVAAFVAGFQDSGDPFFQAATDPADPAVEATVQDKLTQWHMPLRRDDWIVVGPQDELIVMRPAAYARQWEPAPVLSVGVGL